MSSLIALLPLCGRPLRTRAKREEGEEEEERGAPKPCDVAGVAGAEDDASIHHVDAAWHCTASSLHGHDPPLHHHPISHDTNGEPRSFPCSPPDLAVSAMALHIGSA